MGAQTPPEPGSFDLDLLIEADDERRLQRALAKSMHGWQAKPQNAHQDRLDAEKEELRRNLSEWAGL